VSSLLLVLVPGAIFGAIAISDGRRALTEAVGRQLSEHARSAADSLSAAIDAHFADLRTFARQDLMREIRIRDLDKHISAFLASVKQGDESIVELRVIDLQGHVVAASDPSSIGEIAELDAGARPRTDSESLRGPLSTATAPGKVLELAVPIPDPDHGQGSVGRLIALYDWTRETEVASRIRKNMRWITTDANRSAAPSGFIVEHAPRTLVGYTRLHDGSPSWTVLVAQPLVRALAPVHAMTIRLGIALATVLAAALAFAGVLADRLARPLRALTRATQVLSRGGRSVPLVSTRSRDEVGQLATAFNRMSTELRRAQSEVLEAAKFAFVGELAAGVAHEVRTTLGVLSSSAQILRPSLGQRDAEAAELIQIMLDEIDHLDGVVTQLLDLGRPRALMIEPVRLADAVFRAADFVEAQARGKRVTIRRVASPGDVVALCDEGQIYQVALNLLVNAVQMLAPGGAVEIALVPRKDDMVGFEVRDDGPGIPAEMQEKIFLPFFTRREGGIGLGLTFVRRVIQEHRGRLSVESTVGQGSVFRVTLPAAEGSR
jgi:two-component system sensor histidine kinase HydH